MAGDLQAAFQTCRDIVARSDPDRAVSLAFADAGKQDALAALYAFDIETARIRILVSQPLPGEIRLQWWRDAIARPEEQGQGSPVAQALLEVIARYKLPAEAFDRFLEARIFDLYDDPMADRNEFEAYAGETASSLIMLTLFVLADGRPIAAYADAAGHAGVALVATDCLRFEARHRALGQTFVPLDILAAAGVSHADWHGGEGLQTARLALAAYAEEHLARVQSALKQVPRPLRPAFLPALACAPMLKAVTGSGGARPETGITGPLKRSWLYWRAMRA